MALRNPTLVHSHRGLKLTVPAAVEPTTPDELRVVCKTDVAELGDSEAMRLIGGAREIIENLTGLALIEQTWEMSLDCWPGYAEPWWDGVREGHINMLTSGRARPIELPRYPLIAVDTCRVFDVNEIETAVDVALNFNVDTVSTPGRMQLKSSRTWPTVGRNFDAIRLTFRAGYGATPEEVPAGLRDAVLMLAAYYHEHRGDCDLRQAYDKSGVKSMISAYSARGM